MKLLTVYFDDEATMDLVADLVEFVSYNRRKLDFKDEYCDTVICCEGSDIYFEIYDISSDEYFHIPFIQVSETEFDLDRNSYKRLRKYIRKHSKNSNNYDDLFLSKQNFRCSKSSDSTDIIDLPTMCESVSSKYMSNNADSLKAKMSILREYQEYTVKDLSCRCIYPDFTVNCNNKEYEGIINLFSNFGRYVLVQLSYLNTDNLSEGHPTEYTYKLYGFDISKYDISYYLNLVENFSDLQDAFFSTDEVSFITFIDS